MGKKKSLTQRQRTIEIDSGLGDAPVVGSKTGRPKKGTRKPFNTSIDAELIIPLKKLALNEGVTVADLINEAIRKQYNLDV